MHQAKKTYEGVEGTLSVLLSPTLQRGEWSASRSGHFVPGKVHDMHWLEGWVGLDMTMERTSASETQSSNP
jgi:hypothetical protein